MTYLQLSEHRVVIDARKQNSHGVCAVVQEGDASSVQITCKLIDVSLQLCKGCEGNMCKTDEAVFIFFTVNLTDMFFSWLCALHNVSL